MACGQEPALCEVCPPECISMCNCPDAAPYWDDTLGCHGEMICEDLCAAGESWNDDVASCCPGAIDVAGCACDEGLLLAVQDGRHL